jgi:hypothetical protein
VLLNGSGPFIASSEHIDSKWVAAFILWKNKKNNQVVSLLLVALYPVEVRIGKHG